MAKIIFQKGFAYGFDTSACEQCQGRCCIGESGYVWVNPKEIATLAEELDITKKSFINEYLLKIGYRYSIKEISYGEGFRCIFFDEQKKQCQVYAARPNQCRTFPFWERYKTHQSEVEEECPGIFIQS